MSRLIPLLLMLLGLPVLAIAQDQPPADPLVPDDGAQPAADEETEPEIPAPITIRELVESVPAGRTSNLTEIGTFEEAFDRFDRMTPGAPNYRVLTRVTGRAEDGTATAASLIISAFAQEGAGVIARQPSMSVVPFRDHAFEPFSLGIYGYFYTHAVQMDGEQRDIQATNPDHFVKVEYDVTYDPTLDTWSISAKRLYNAYEPVAPLVMTYSYDATGNLERVQIQSKDPIGDGYSPVGSVDFEVPAGAQANANDLVTPTWNALSYRDGEQPIFRMELIGQAETEAPADPAEVNPAGVDPADPTVDPTATADATESDLSAPTNVVAATEGQGNYVVYKYQRLRLDISPDEYDEALASGNAATASVAVDELSQFVVYAVVLTDENGERFVGYQAVYDAQGGLIRIVDRLPVEEEPTEDDTVEDLPGLDDEPGTI